MRDTFRERVVVKGIVSAETALRIGGGSSLEPVGTDLPVVKDIFNRPYIPGSSFKGVLRSTIERLIRGIDPKKACLITDEHSVCLTNDRVKALKKQFARDDENLTKAIVNESCWVCRIFGSNFLAARVLVKDLNVEESSWAGIYQVRDGVAIDRETGTAAKNKKYDFEVVPPSTRFIFEMHIEDASEEELGMVFAGLAEFERGAVALGGSRTRGLGQVRLEISECSRVSAKSLTQYLLSGAMEPVDRHSSIQTFVHALSETRKKEGA